MLLPESLKRKKYMRFVKWYIENYVDYKTITGFDNFDFFLTSATHFNIFTDNISHRRNMHAIFNQKRAGSNDFLSLIGKSFNLPFTYGSIIHTKDVKKQDLHYTKFLALENGDLEENINEGRVQASASTIIKKWVTKGNKTTPQWADFLEMPLEGKLVKQINCQVKTDSEYFRLGFKLFRTDGRLFGDGSIQSLDNNFVIHIAKNFLIKELFVTTYRNGILENRDKYLKLLASKNWLDIGMTFDNEGFLHFTINNIEVIKTLLNRESRQKVYMLAWADGNDFKIEVKDIKIESCNE
ncbi:MAG: hypothetical protein Q8M15_17075 [Bacteroidota bacterium]|nr:hypothetical protein [Bacteroidota bacterium]